MTYYPSGHDVILFGGFGYPAGSLVQTYFQDTWAFSGRTWTPLIQNSTCTNTTCPSPRAGAMIAYYPTDNALVLFGGYNYSISGYNAYNDTWLFENDSWTNITKTAGTPPSPRFWGVMTYDPSDNYDLLFGGSTADGHSLGDTWTFSHGVWANITSQEGGVNGYKTDLAPEPRARASIASSPSGYVMLFGGADGSTTIENDCDNGTYAGVGLSSVAWWFFKGKWLPETNWGYDAASEGCLPHSPVRAGPAPATAYPAMSPPCGRIDAALGWSPKNSRFVLYGGYGPPLQGPHGSCLGAPPYGYPDWLNDTWLYAFPPGGSFLWYNVSDAGDPPARTEPGYASDFTGGYFDIFGGVGAPGFLSETWRFYAIVHAKITGPADIDTASTTQFTSPFFITAFGGSGNLAYSFGIQGLRNSNTLNGGGCSELTGGKVPPLDYSGTASISCTPTAASFNVYRLNLGAVDAQNSSDRASANWTFVVSPPEAMDIDSEFTSYFFTNVNFQNTFSIYAAVNHGPALGIAATLGGNPVVFQQRSGNAYWWDLTVQMSSVAPDSTILATAQFGNWTLNATYDIPMVEAPSWLLSLFHYSGAAQSIDTSGPGPYNKSFTIDETYSWNLGQALGFSLPVPLVGGDYDLIPSMTVVLSASSLGYVNLTGTLSLQPPAINFGAFDLQLSADLSLQGTFQIGSTGSGVPTIQWESATALVSVTGDFSGSVPLYGFSILGVTIGFVLDVDVNPSVSLEMLLAPTTETSQEIIHGIGVMVTQVLGGFQLPLSVSVNFGIGFASVGIGGTLSVALTFQLDPSVGILAGWVNGSVFVQASALFWSDSWTLVGGTIYSWNDPPGAAPRPAARPDTVGYNNGTGTTWTLHSRYYSSGAYDDRVWKALGDQGTAISDIYPNTQVAGASAYNGAYLFYTDDNSSQPVQSGLDISAVHLDASTNQLTSVPGPVSPGFLVSSPRATTLPDGDIAVVWNALPTAEEGLSGPLGLTQLELQGAIFDPATDTWGPVRTYSSWGIAQSFQVDATKGPGELAELNSPSFTIGDTTAERLVTYNLTTGAELSNASVTGLSELVSVRSGIGDAVVQDLDGNYSVLALGSGNALPIGYAPPSNSSLISESFVQGSPSDLVLLYRERVGAQLVLYDPATSTTVGALPVGGNASDAQAVASGSTIHAFVRTGQGIEGWTWSNGAFANYTEPREPGISSYGVVGAGSSYLIYSLANSGGNASAPTRSLDFDEVGAALPPMAPPPSASTSSSSSGPLGSNSTALFALILGIVAVVVLLLLAVIAYRGRRPPSSPASAPPTVGDPPSPPPPTAPPSPPPVG
jgi:hypothetical protein